MSNVLPDIGTARAFLLLLLGFAFIIFIHELGHFLVAKAVGIKCQQFAIGFVNIAVPSDAERIHLILAAEKVAPFGSRLLRLDQVSIEQGRNDLEKWMRTWADCVEANYYPNYDPAITEILIPSYAIKIEDWEAPE